MTASSNVICVPAWGLSSALWNCPAATTGFRVCKKSVTSVKQSLTAAASTTRNPGVIVPKSALLSRDGRDVAFVVTNGRAERRAITVALAVGGEATLSAGVSAGERIIVEAPPTLADGALVEEKRL